MSENLHKRARQKIFFFARQNRKVMTEAEKVLWGHLRDRRLNGFKFRRQHPIANFIVDFFCLEAHLVVEVDGEYHDETDQKAYDEARTFELSELQIKVIRFTNNEVIGNTRFVLDEIERHLKIAKS
jgi:very-short-patch-repair endonuclease